MFAKQQSILSKHKNDLSDRPASAPLQSSPSTSPQTDLLRPSPAPVAPAPAPQASATPAPQAPQGSAEGEPTGSRLIVGPDVKLKGAEILDCDTLVVEGRVEATMDSRVIRIAQNGAFSGKVGIDVAEIHGEFEGDLTAREQLVIHATGRVKGTIRYGKLLIESGGIISGDVQSLSEAKAARAGEQRDLLSNVKSFAAG